MLFELETSHVEVVQTYSQRLFTTQSEIHLPGDRTLHEDTSFPFRISAADHGDTVYCTAGTGLVS